MKTLIPVNSEETPMEISARIAKLSAIVYQSMGINDDNPFISGYRHLKNKDLANEK